MRCTPRFFVVLESDDEIISWDAEIAVLGVVLVVGIAGGGIALPARSAATTPPATTPLSAAMASAAATVASTSLIPAPPVRVLDTRTGTGAARAAVPAGGHLLVQIGGRGVPANASAAALNITVTGTHTAGYLQIGPPTAPVSTSS